MKTRSLGCCKLSLFCEDFGPMDCWIVYLNLGSRKSSPYCPAPAVGPGSIDCSCSVLGRCRGHSSLKQGCTLYEFCHNFAVKTNFENHKRFLTISNTTFFFKFPRQNIVNVRAVPFQFSLSIRMPKHDMTDVKQPTNTVNCDQSLQRRILCSPA